MDVLDQSERVDLQELRFARRPLWIRAGNEQVVEAAYADERAVLVELEEMCEKGVAAVGEDNPRCPTERRRGAGA